MKKVILLIIILSTINALSKQLIVGLDGDIYQFTNVRGAALQALPGDTILITGGVYPGGEYIENLKGEEMSEILIMAMPGDSVIFRGGSQAFHFVEMEYVTIDGLIFEGQTGNGVNIDDGGTYDTPTRYINIQNCHWRSMNATGNNDELKLSGVDYFVIQNCSFKNGSAGGSLVDMVGCHYGQFIENHFENGGSNSIQAKGGTSQIVIQRNMFINGGSRAINIGGSTGLPYFRPMGADYEAQYIYVGANIFIGSETPIAFVGALNSIVTNNTFINPEKYAINILQESVEGFRPCGQNVFVNNICYLNNSKPSYTINIGPNTAPETFLFSNNLWYNFENENWQGPNLPVEESNGIIGQDPKFEDFANNNFKLKSDSPAIQKGAISFNEELPIPPNLDFDSIPFLTPPSIGAFEYFTLDVEDVLGGDEINISPNPASEYIEIKLSESYQIKIYNTLGQCVIDLTSTLPYTPLTPLERGIRVDVSGLPVGMYFVRIGNYSEKIMVVR